MERVFNYREASDYFTDLIGNGKIAGTSFLLMGKGGWGKTAALNYIEKFAQKNGMKVYRARSFYSDESLMYQAYNELLNQLLDNFEERDLARIVELFAHFKGEKAKNTMFILDNIESMIQPSRELFVYLSRLCEKNGFSFMASFNEELILDQDVVRKFLNVISMETNLWVINFRKPDLEDMNYFIRQRGFHLPESFIQELYRLTNGNLRYTEYALNYYQERGIINQHKELEEVTYRFFPIPPSFESRLDRGISEMQDPDISVLGLVALTAEELSPSFIARMLGLPRSDTLNILERLSEMGYLTRNETNYSLVNRRINDLVLRALPEKRTRVLSDEFLKSPGFQELPTLTRIRIYLLVKDPEAITLTIEKEWSEIRQKLPFINSSPDIFITIMGMVSEESAKAHAALLAAYAHEISNQIREAISLCTQPEVMKTEPVFAKITLARLYRKAGMYSDSIDLCKDLVSNLESDSRDYAETVMTLAVDFSYMENHELTLKYAEEARSVSERNAYDDVLAESLNLLGTINVKSFNLQKALEYYKKSLDLNRSLRHYEAELLSLNNIAIIYSYQGMLKESSEMLTQIIEKSYISGALMSRAYATYNLCEIYYTSGKFDEFRKYITSAQKLVRIVNDSNLTYPFLRFMATINLNSFNLSNALSFINELCDLAATMKNPMQEVICRGLRYIGEGLESGNFNPNLDKVFLNLFDEADDFLPLWYTIGTVKFGLDGNREACSRAADLALKQAEGMGDFIGTLVARIARAVALAVNGKKKDLKAFIEDKLSDESKLYSFSEIVKALDCYARDDMKSYRKQDKPSSLLRLGIETILGYHDDAIGKDGTSKGEYVRSVYLNLADEVPSIYDGIN